MTTKHSTEVLPRSGTFMPRCSCGWVGYPTTTAKEAREDAYLHKKHYARLHRPFVKWRGMADYLPFCSCGWAGHPAYSQSAAIANAIAHIREQGIGYVMYDDVEVQRET